MALARFIRPLLLLEFSELTQTGSIRERLLGPAVSCLLPNGPGRSSRHNGTIAFCDCSNIHIIRASYYQTGRPHPSCALLRLESTALTQYEGDNCWRWHRWPYHGECLGEGQH